MYADFFFRVDDQNRTSRFDFSLIGTRCLIELASHSIPHTAIASRSTTAVSPVFTKYPRHAPRLRLRSQPTSRALDSVYGASHHLAWPSPGDPYRGTKCIAERCIIPRHPRSFPLSAAVQLNSPARELTKRKPLLFSRGLAPHGSLDTTPEHQQHQQQQQPERVRPGRNSRSEQRQANATLVASENIMLLHDCCASHTSEPLTFLPANERIVSNVMLTPRGCLYLRTQWYLGKRDVCYIHMIREVDFFARQLRPHQMVHSNMITERQAHTTTPDTR